MSVKVAVRTRPLSANEVKSGSPVVVRMNGNAVEVVGASGTSGRTFRYDEALWSTGVKVEASENAEASQECVYEAIGAEMLSHAITGYNGCIFAYGQTGSGKTYSMMGTEDSPGIVPRLAESLFAEAERLRQRDIETCIEVSYYEIYCEKARCLLRPTAGGFEDSVLRVREHPKFGPFIEGLAKFVVGTQAEFLQLMNDGNKVRTTASTAMNATSSRSHAVFAITLTQKKKTGKFVTTTTSKLNLVDLAGSERASKTMATGQRLAEGANINQSLTCLGNVISALAEVEETGKKRHIPYRDSVLTWVLKDNLGGNSKTVMLATISPSSAQYEETMSTLRYAERAKKIVNKAVVNESNNNEVIAALQKEITNLKSQLSNASTAERDRLLEELAASEAMQKDLSTSLEEKLAETKSMMEEREKYMRELEHKLAAQTNEIEELKRVNDEKERKIADLLQRIEAMASAAATGGGAGSDSLATGSPTNTGQTMMDKMREEVAALEQQQNAAETQLKGRRRLTEVGDDDDDDLSMLMDAEEPQVTGEGYVNASTVGTEGAAVVAPSGTVRKATSMFLEEEDGSEHVPAALRKGWRQESGGCSTPGTGTTAGQSTAPGVGGVGVGAFDMDLESLDSADSFNENMFYQPTGAIGGSLSADADPSSVVDDSLDVDSDIALSEDSALAALDVDEDIVLDDETATSKAQSVATPAATGLPAPPATTPITTTTPSSATALSQVHEDPRASPSRPVYEQAIGAQVVRVEHLQPGGVASQQEAQQRQPSHHQDDTGLASEIQWARAEARPEIFAPAQRAVELVVPSHALPNSRYLHEPFKVVKMSDGVLIGHRKDRLWDIDFFSQTFGNYDLHGTKSFSLSSTHLFRVEKSPINPRRLTLYFFEAPHPYELEFASASRRRRFYELATLQRRNSIMWCPSLCFDRENDVAITVRGTTIERPNRGAVNVHGETKFTVARMPYEVIDFWYGCFSLQGGALPRNTAVLGSFIPKGTHDVYVLGVADVPSSLLGNDEIGHYFVTYLGSDDYYVIGTTTMNYPKRRGTYNSMLIICRRSFIVRIANVQLIEAPTVHKRSTSRGDFTAIACSFTVNEASICAILVNAKPGTKCDAQTRNTFLRTLITSFPFGDTSVDIVSRFDYLIVSGNFGFAGCGSAFTGDDALLQQIRVNNLMSNLRESEPSATLKATRDPMRIFFSVRPRVSRMDVGLYTTSRAFAAVNSYITADMFSQRPYLSVFGESVPRVQLIFDRIMVGGARLPDVKNAQIHISGDFFEGSPLAAPTLRPAPKQYAVTSTAIPIIYPVVGNPEFLRLQTVYFSLVGTMPSPGKSKPTTLASGSLPLKSVLSLGETKDFSVPLYYQSCLVGVLQGNLLEIFYEKNYAEVAAAGLGRERFVSLVHCYENQFRVGDGVWVPASAQPPMCDFSTKDPSRPQRKQDFTLPEPLAWRWLTDWKHDSLPDDPDGWVYSDGGGTPLHFKESKASVVRRRRWMRAMQAQDALTLHNYLAFKYAQMRENVTQ